MDINKTFAYHKPSPESLDAITRLRKAFSDLKAELEYRCPASRERAVALTELETSAMWAIKAVVSNDPTSIPQLETEPMRTTEDIVREAIRGLDS
jgi:hypothetical protein